MKLAKAMRRLVPVLAFLLFATACEDQAVSVQVIAVRPIDDEQCEVEIGGDRFLAGGIVDLALARSYTAFAQVVNNMADIRTINRYTERDGRLNTHDVLLRSALIEFTALDKITANIPEQVRIPLSGTVTIDGAAYIGLELLNFAQLQELRSAPEFLTFDAQNNILPVRGEVKITARIRMEGETLDGKFIESNEFIFPITICNGCLISYSPEALVVDETNNQLVCRNPNEVEPDSTLFEAPSCPGLVGTDSRFVNCVQCRGFAVDAVAAQLCDPR